MIAIYGTRRQEEHLDALRSFFASLREREVEFCVSRRFGDYLEDQGIMISASEKVDSVPESATLAVSIGGDGTFLRTSAWLACREIPVMGINTGHLGYLAAFSFDRRDEVDAAIAGEFEVSPRMTVEIETDALPDGFDSVALNEISVAKGDTTSMVNILTEIDDEYLADYVADGLLVSTPTGSTAYNLSCGGPIVEPTASNLIITPIASHSLTHRPLVVGSESELRLHVATRGAEAHVGVDGRTFAVRSGTVLTIRKSRGRVLVAQPKGMGFASVLRRKLGWGLRGD